MVFPSNTTSEMFVHEQNKCKIDARKVDRTFPTFANDARNIRFGLSTDVMNPFDEQSSGHSTWPVTLYIYLPPWLCMKRKFIMMPVLIPGPKQLGNVIDVYLKPLI